MILGVTCNEDGSLVQKLPVTRKIAIGLAPSGSRNYPEKLSHFIALCKSGEKGVWVIDEALMKKLAPLCRHEPSEECDNCCKSIDILFVSNEIDQIFDHKLAWWTRSSLRCSGDGREGFRITEEFPRGTKWTPCGQACHDLHRGDCSFSGDLRFVLASDPDLGSVARIHTGSARSIQNIFSALNEISDLTGGRLAGVTASLCVSMEKTNYTDDAGKKHSSVSPILSLRTNIPKLIEDMKKTGALFESARKALGSKRIVVEEDPGEQAPEISAEFPAKSKALPAPAETASPKEEAKPEPQTEPAKPETKPPAAPKAEASKEEQKREGPKPSGQVKLDGVIDSIHEKDDGRGKKFHEIMLKPSSPEPKSKGSKKTTKIAMTAKLSPQSVFTGIESAVKQAAREVTITCDIYENPKPNGDPILVAVDFAFKAVPAIAGEDVSGSGEFSWLT